jgi:hypothetical protein
LPATVNEFCRNTPVIVVALHDAPFTVAVKTFDDVEPPLPPELLPPPELPVLPEGDVVPPPQAHVNKTISAVRTRKIFVIMGRILTD